MRVVRPKAITPPPRRDTVHKKLALVLLSSLTLIACVIAAPGPAATGVPTARPTATPEPTAMPTARPTATASPTSEPTPLRAQSGSIPFWDWDNLAPYRQAMRPAFAADVDRFVQATRYAIEVRVDVEAHAFQGTEYVRYTNHEDESLTEVVFRLLPNTPGYGGTLVVPVVTVDGTRVTTHLSLAGSALHVPLAAPLVPGETVELGLAFEGGYPTDGAAGYSQYGMLDDVLALPNLYPMIPVYDDEGWNLELAPPYGDATFTDTALYAVRVTLPDDMILAASGVTVERQDNGDGTTTYTIASGPMRDWTMVASAIYETHSTQVGDVKLTAYVRPGAAVGGKNVLDYAARSLTIYEEWIGPYPFNELDVVSTPTRAGGIEYPGLIVIADNLYGRIGGFFEVATVHEVAHQWWYSLVGNDQLDEPWLDEALTQYTSLLYFEHRYDADRAQQFLEQMFLSQHASLLENDEDMPAGLPVAAYPEDLYGAVVYGKGPLFFHEIRRLVGDDTFYAILRAYLAQYRYGVAYPQDFLAIAEQTSGQELDALYEEWIAGPRD
jgi:peptidase M1-like protein